MATSMQSEGVRTSSSSAVVPLALGVLVTLSYCWAIWWVMGLFSVLTGVETSDRSRLSMVLIAPLNDSFWFKAIHWQLLAAASLLVNIAWSLHLRKTRATDTCHALPLGCHLAWILSCLFLHVVGFLASMVSVVYILE